MCYSLQAFICETKNYDTNCIPKYFELKRNSINLLTLKDSHKNNTRNKDNILLPNSITTKM